MSRPRPAFPLEPDPDGPPQGRARRAFTLLEVLLAILLLSVGIAVVLQFCWVNLRLAQLSYTNLVAIKGVQEYELEYLRSLTFNDPALNVATNVPFTTPALNATPNVDQLPNGSATYTVQLEGGDPNLKRVTVTVNWTDQNQRARSAVASTLISQ